MRLNYEYLQENTRTLRVFFQTREFFSSSCQEASSGVQLECKGMRAAKHMDERITKFVLACEAALYGKYDVKSHFSLIQDVATAVRNDTEQHCEVWVPERTPHDTAVVLQINEDTGESDIVHMQLSDQQCLWKGLPLAFTIQILEQFKDKTSGKKITSRHGLSM